MIKRLAENLQLTIEDIESLSLPKSSNSALNIYKSLLYLVSIEAVGKKIYGNNYKSQETFHKTITEHTDWKYKNLVSVYGLINDPKLSKYAEIKTQLTSRLSVLFNRPSNIIRNVSNIDIQYNDRIFNNSTKDTKLEKLINNYRYTTKLYSLRCSLAHELIAQSEMFADTTGEPYYAMEKSLTKYSLVIPLTQAKKILESLVTTTKCT